ncbi:MAG: hypothetical protein JNJ54_20205 [Myxococcaceae bacterium]|nr:hypothetical protein [Myxococcaceae bacterium]
MPKAGAFERGMKALPLLVGCVTVVALSCGPPSLGLTCRTSFDCGAGLDCLPGSLGGLGGSRPSMCTRTCAADADCAQWASGRLEARCPGGLQGSGRVCMAYDPRPASGLAQLLVAPGLGGAPGFIPVPDPASPRLAAPGLRPGTAPR